MTRRNRTLKTVAPCLLAALLMVLGGCSGDDDGGDARDDGDATVWETLTITDDVGTGCELVIYSPPYGENARAPDDVTIVWDGRQVFSGVLPSRNGGPTGMPVTLLRIVTGPGEHVVEVIHGSKSQKLTIELENGQKVRTALFDHDLDGRMHLIRDIGDPGFS